MEWGLFSGLPVTQVTLVESRGGCPGFFPIESFSECSTAVPCAGELTPPLCAVPELNSASREGGAEACMAEPRQPGGSVKWAPLRGGRVMGASPWLGWEQPPRLLLNAARGSQVPPPGASAGESARQVLATPWELQGLGLFVRIVSCCLSSSEQTGGQALFWALKVE